MANPPPASTFTAHLAFTQTGPNSWSTIHPPQRMGNALPIAYGGYALAAACKAASLSAPQEYTLYSLLGNFLSPARTDRPLHAHCTVIRQTRSFATRHVSISQTLDDGTQRTCLFATADFHAPEQSMLEYSRRPSRTYTHHASLAAPTELARRLLATGTITQATHDAYVSAFALSSALYDMRPCPEGIFAQNLSGVAKTLPHSQENVPLAERTTADWFRCAGKLDSAAEQRAALAFQSDAALSFCPLAFSHMYLDDTAACSSLDFALRFFREVDVEKWCLREISTHAGSGGRSFSECWIWDEERRAVASMSQQGIVRALAGKGRL